MINGIMAVTLIRWYDDANAKTLIPCWSLNANWLVSYANMLTAFLNANCSGCLWLVFCIQLRSIVQHLKGIGPFDEIDG